MTGPLLIVISGAPGSGKTTLARLIASQHQLPLFSKDAFKEMLFNNLGWNDKAWSKKLSLTAYDLLYYSVESTLQAGQSVMMEANFQPVNATPHLLNLQQQYKFRTLQLFCQAAEAVSLQRYNQRAQTGVRHPGHLDELQYEEQKAALAVGIYRPLEIEGQVIKLDTSDLQNIDYSEILGAVEKALK